jgi:hypothetical protein
MLSTKNIARMEEGLSPVVDSHWLKHFPEHQNYINQILEHHHLGHGPFAVPLPKELHRGTGNKLIWHDK